MSEQEPLRVGLVGCGNQGGALAQAILRTDVLRLVACADSDERALSRVAALTGDVARHASLDALLASIAVDAVIIATPHHLLAPLALAAIRAGKHAFVEKPLALNEAEAKEIEFAAASADVTCMAGYSIRFSMAGYVHDLLAQGVVGEIQAITGSFGTAPMDRGWVASPESGGGPLLYVGCHLIDLVLWFVGDEPVTVYADVRRRADTGTDATSAIQLGFATGALAQFLVTQAAPSTFYELHILGRSGSITLRGRNFLQFEIEVHSNAVRAFNEPTTIRPQIQRDNISMMLVPELQEFAAAVQEQRLPSITASDGRRVLRVLDAVAESGRSGQVVALDLPVLAAY